MSIIDHLDTKNLHHAYLVEGMHTSVVPEVLAFIESLGIEVVANPDLYRVHIDNFKMDEALQLRAMSIEKSFSGAKKFFILSVNSFAREAQQVLLKMFEEPRPDTHFFLILPDKDILLPTVLSRMYCIDANTENTLDIKQAEKFITMNTTARIEFLKEFLAASDESDEENLALESNRSKALKFLNAVETALHNKTIAKSKFEGTDIFSHMFKVREYLRMPGSSVKSLLESVALTIPNC